VAPLDGMRVATLALNVPGPVAAARLRELGAVVTKVEPPAGDPLERSSPAWYRDLADGQEVVRLDLKDERERPGLDALLAQADLLLTAQRPSALARLGLAWPELRERFPRLCQVAIVGEPAPEQERAGHDLTYLAPRGLLTPPELPPTLMADLLGAELAATAAIGALLARERGQPAAYVEVALADAADLLAEPLRRGLTARSGTLGGAFAGYGLYEASDGWVAVAALEPRFRARLREGLGLERLTHEALARAFAERRADEWVRWARERDVPLERVERPR
jgi:crotonobetainyl-CoA:carnitine CoA-transferase CaiB-like acyl-CoA transferase